MAVTEEVLADDIQRAAERAAREPVIDFATPEGRAIDALYRRIRGDIEESSGGWNGGDVVDAVAETFQGLGYDLDAPYRA
jgi:hypothetical protein